MFIGDYADYSTLVISSNSLARDAILPCPEGRLQPAKRATTNTLIPSTILSTRARSNFFPTTVPSFSSSYVPFISPVFIAKHQLTSFLPQSYLIGLWFSLRTHASQIWQNAQPSHEAGTVSGGRPLTGVGLPAPASTSAERSSIYKRVLPSNFLSAITPSATPRILSMSIPSNTAPGNVPLSNLQLPSGMSPEDFSAAMEAASKTAGSGRIANPAVPPLHRQTSHADVAVKHEAEGESGGHDAPNWSRSKSASVLMGCTILYAIIAGECFCFWMG